METLPFEIAETAHALRNASGDRAGYLVVFEAEDRAAAEALDEGSPIRRAGLYSEFHLLEYQNEVG